MNSYRIHAILGLLLCFGSTQGLKAQEAVAPTVAAPAATPAAESTPAAVQPAPAATVPSEASAPAAAQAGAVPAKPQVTKQVVIPYDLQQYRVLLTLGIPSKLGLSAHEQSKIELQWSSRVRSRIGELWQADIRLAGSSEPRSRAALESINPSQWNRTMEPTLYDKRFALTIDRVGTEFQVSGIEWDRSSQSTTQIQSRQTYDRRVIAELATNLTFRLFRPQVSVETVVEKQAELRIRGGELIPPDASLTPFTPGEFIGAYARYSGKKREFLRVQQIPWTTVRVDMVNRGLMKGTIVSAFVAPISGQRRRVESLGMKINPEWPSTTLKVIPRGRPEAPMAGYRVEVLNRPETKEDKVEDRQKLRTNRYGEVLVPRDPAHPLQYLVVYSGNSPIAKAPLIPGHEPRVTLSAPDDAPRLNVEAETELLQSELIDIVAKREVLMSRARGAVKKGNWDLATELTGEVGSLPTLEQFLGRIETVKLPAIQTAKKNKDKGQESRIVRMCKQVADMATTHLDPTKVKEFLVEMEEEKKNR